MSTGATMRGKAFGMANFNNQGGGPPPGYPPPGAPPQGAPQQGYPQQGAPQQGFPQQPQQGYPQQGAPPQGYPPPQQPGYAPPGAPPQGYPPPQQQGYPPPQQQGYPQQGAPPQGYAPPQQQGYPPPQQQQQPGYAPPQPGYPPQGYNPQDPLAQMGLAPGGLPTNAWIPAALISFFFPGIGLFFLPDPRYKPLAIKIFVAYLVVMIFLPVAISIVSSVTGIYAIGYLGYAFHLLRLVVHPGAAIHTHDCTVKLNPALGQPLFFKN